jgi:outer membrane protein OmpA-like peptidoglycan-associated protein
MNRTVIVLLMSTVVGVNSACVASRKFVRNEVKTSTDSLGARIDARIDTNEGDIKEVRDGVAAVDGKVGRLDARTTEQGQRLDGLNGEVRTLDRNLQMADQKASSAQNAADEVAGEVTLLDQKFQSRNQYVIASEKSVFFKFNSAQLDTAFRADLDEIAEALKQNADALIVLEGRTDSTGQDEYNVRLGERRSEAVKRYLVVDKGVPVYRLHQISFGAARPVADNSSRQGREKNRVVTVLVLVPRTAPTTASR